MKKYEKILIPNNNITYSFTKEDFEDLKYLIDERKENEEKKPPKDREKFYIDELKIGDVVIFEAKDKKVKDLSFSEIPRLRYKLSPLDLVPKAFHPCTSEKLCFACRMFGTIGDHSENKEKIKKTEKSVAMISKVFISDALSIKNKDESLEEKLTLKSLGEPHPSLASFYLEKGTYNDSGVKIRGRKFYWHHSDKIEAGDNYAKYIDTIKDKESTTNSTIWFLKPNQEFEIEVSFKDLTKDELGILVYSLDLEDNLLHKLGKAKAFGLGSCKIEITDCLLESKGKYNSFTKSYDSFDKNEFLDVAKKEYKFDTSDRLEIKELKAILNVENNLDFSKSAFPEAPKEDKAKNITWNTLNWFVNQKKELKDNFRLPTISEYMKSKK